MEGEERRCTLFCTCCEMILACWYVHVLDLGISSFVPSPPSRNPRTMVFYSFLRSHATHRFRFVSSWDALHSVSPSLMYQVRGCVPPGLSLLSCITYKSSCLLASCLPACFLSLHPSHKRPHASWPKSSPCQGTQLDTSSRLPNPAWRRCEQIGIKHWVTHRDTLQFSSHSLIVATSLTEVEIHRVGKNVMIRRGSTT